MGPARWFVRFTRCNKRSDELMKGRGAPPANHRRYFWLPNPCQECNPLDRAQGPEPWRSPRKERPALALLAKQPVQLLANIFLSQGQT